MNVTVELELVSFECRKEIVSKLTDPNVLDQIIDFYSISGLRVIAAMNENLSEKSLLKLAQDKNAEVRRLVAENPKASAKVLDILSNNTEWYIRYLVAAHPNTSNETIAKLENDEDVKVQKKARGRKTI